jgi:hypothetical protein
MTNTFKPAGAALAAVVAGLSGPATLAAEAPDLSAGETPMAQAEAFARGLAALGGGDTPFGESAPNSALLDVPLGGVGDPPIGHG